VFPLPPFDINAPTLDEFRQLLVAHEIEIADEEPDLGFIAFYFGGLYGNFTRNGHHYAHVPLLYHDDTNLTDRSSFDAEYHRIRELITGTHGKPTQEGQHVYAHRQPNHFYLYSVWPLQHCRLALLQNEYDIQFGLDLSLRYLYRDGDVESLLYAENGT